MLSTNTFVLCAALFAVHASEYRQVNREPQWNVGFVGVSQNQLEERTQTCFEYELTFTASKHQLPYNLNPNLGVELRFAMPMNSALFPGVSEYLHEYAATVKSSLTASHPFRVLLQNFANAIELVFEPITLSDLQFVADGKTPTASTRIQLCTATDLSKTAAGVCTLKPVVKCEDNGRLVIGKMQTLALPMPDIRSLLKSSLPSVESMESMATSIQYPSTEQLSLIGNVASFGQLSLEHSTQPSPLVQLQLRSEDDLYDDVATGHSLSRGSPDLMMSDWFPEPLVMTAADFEKNAGENAQNQNSYSLQNSKETDSRKSPLPVAGNGSDGSLAEVTEGINEWFSEAAPTETAHRTVSPVQIEDASTLGLYSSALDAALKQFRLLHSRDRRPLEPVGAALNRMQTKEEETTVVDFLNE